MGTAHTPYLFSAEHLNSLNEQDTILEVNNTPPLQKYFVYQVSFCLFAPRTITVARLWKLWEFEIAFRILILTMLVAFLFTKRLFPRRKIPRMTNLLFYMLGLGNRIPPLRRRELFILVLFGIGFHSLLNLLSAQHIAFKTVNYQAKQFQTIQEVLDAGFFIKVHKSIQPHLSKIDQTIEDRLIFEDSSMIDLKARNYSHLITCEMAKQLYREHANYDPETDQPRMAPVDEVVLTIFHTLEAPFNIAENGLREHLNRFYLFMMYGRTLVGNTDRTRPRFWFAIFGDHSATFLMMATSYYAATIVFLMECLVYRVQTRRITRRCGFFPVLPKARIIKSKSEPAIMKRRVIQKASGYKTD